MMPCNCLNLRCDCLNLGLTMLCISVVSARLLTIHLAYEAGSPAFSCLPATEASETCTGTAGLPLFKRKRCQ